MPCVDAIWGYCSFAQKDVGNQACINASCLDWHDMPRWHEFGISILEHDKVVSYAHGTHCKLSRAQAQHDVYACTAVGIVGVRGRWGSMHFFRAGHATWKIDKVAILCLAGQQTF